MGAGRADFTVFISALDDLGDRRIDEIALAAATKVLTHNSLLTRRFILVAASNYPISYLTGGGGGGARDCSVL